jgi:hypothetical protein
MQRKINVLLSHHQNAGQNYDMKIENRYAKCGKVQVFENNSNKICFRLKLRGDWILAMLATIEFVFLSAI